MSVANLPRYEMEQCGDGGSGGWGEMSKCDSGEWVKFEEAMEASSNSLQQLKAKIRALSDELSNDDSHPLDFNPEYYVVKMRELSAVYRDVVQKF